MAEFSLNGLSLQELHVINEQQVDIAQRLLERQGGVIADGGGKAPHEIFCGQVENLLARIAASGFPGNCLKQMRLPQANRSMNEQRIEADRTRIILCHSSGRGIGHAVRLAFNEGRKTVAAVERGTGKSGHAVSRPLGLALASAVRA